MSLKTELRTFLGVPNTVGEGDSIQDAHDAGVDHIALSPDYDPHVEDYPITIDLTDEDDDRPFRLDGVGPAVSQIGHEDVDVPVLDIQGRGSRSYREAPTISGVSIEGGAPGLRLAGTPFASVSDVVVSGDDHGVVLASGEDGAGTFGVSFFNVQSWGSGGDGFRLQSGAATHGTNWYGCNATANGGAGFRLRGYNNTIFGGVTQLNHGYGVAAREAPSTTVSGAYIEGNARKKDYPVEVYGRGAHGLTVENSYFNGINPRTVWHDHDHVLRGVNVHESRAVTVKDCVVRNYDDAFIAFFDSYKPDVYADSHAILDDTSLVSTAGMQTVLSNGHSWQKPD